MPGMRFGIDLAQQRMDWDELLGRVRLCEDLGFDGMWGFDKVGLQVGIYNGENYNNAPGDAHKDVEGRLSVRLARTNLAGKAGGLRLNAYGQFGKSTGGGNLWLDPEMTSPYAWYQYFVNAADADELVQETYVRVLARAHTFMGGNLKGWLFRILQNSYIDMRRRSRRQPAAGDYDISDDAVEASLVRDRPKADGLSGIVTEEIETALAGLSDDARTIVLLDLGGFTESEVAEVIGCAVGTVKSRLSRARAILRERLSEHAPPSWRREHTKAGER